MVIRAMLAVLLVGAATLPVSAQYMTYSDWENLSRPSRGIYMAGLFDAFLQSSVMYNHGETAKHYMTCIQKAGMPNGTLADNVYTFIEKHPEAKAASLQDSLVRYLNELCGNPSRQN